MADYTLTITNGTLSISGQAVTLTNRRLSITAGTLALAGQSVTVNAQLAETFTLNFIIDVYVDPLTSANVVDHSESLTVDGTPISLKSWSFEETDQSIYGTLNAELNDLDQRDLLTSTASINFSVNGETLLDTGRMERKDYSISRKGIGAADTVTFVAMPEMEARLNTVPPVPLVLYDPLRHNVTADDFEGIYDTNGNYDPPEVVPVSGLSFHRLLDRVMVDRCGFSDYITDIPDFPIMSVVTFDAGVAYFNVIGSICAMFNPDLSTIDEGDGPVFTIRNGTAGIAPGMPAPRQVGVSNASDLGVATELARVDSLLIDVTKDRFAYDYYDDRLPETEVVTEGSSGFFSSQYTETTTTSYYRDYYRNSQPNLPVKSELIRQTMVQEQGPFGGVFLSTDENFQFDAWGRVIRRTKVTEALMPDPFNSFAMGLIEVEREDETITYKLHPFEPRTYYTAKREINKGGIIVIDGENKQLGTDYARDIVNAYRSGNLVDTMTAIEGKISQFVETITPRRNKRIKVTNYEVDFTPLAVGLSPIFINGDSSEKDGEVGVNIFVQEQQKMYIFQPGETEIGGTIERVNMGELPQEIAVALGERILLQRTAMPNRVSFNIPYIDMSLQRGTPINAIGRDGEDLGNYIIEARTLNCSEHNGRGPRYSMTLQAREA